MAFLGVTNVLSMRKVARLKIEVSLRSGSYYEVASQSQWNLGTVVVRCPRPDLRVMAAQVITGEQKHGEALWQIEEYS